jgi:two-component system sensor histidine kinase SenX3
VAAQSSGTDRPAKGVDDPAEDVDKPAGRRRIFGVPAVAVPALPGRTTRSSGSRRSGRGSADSDRTTLAAITPAAEAAASAGAATGDRPVDGGRRPTGHRGVPASGDMPADVLRILSALTTPALWVDASGAVLWVHPALAELRLVRRGAITSADITRMVQSCLARDEQDGRDLTIRRPGRRQSAVRLRVRVAPMQEGAALVLIEDITEAERLDHARRDFVANVSHELKTPIGALALLAEAAHDAGDDTEALARFTSRMQVETRRLTTLVNDLMDLSRLEGVEPLVPMGPVPVDEVVAQACDDARSLAQDKGIKFLRGGVPGLEVEGVAEQLATAVRNLLVNAINYSPASTKVAVTTGVTEGYVTIAVTDQGIGIPTAELDRIFERFYRVDPARSRVTGGTGLGLSIVKHVCANHGGDCEVWSKVGEGSTFTIRLPAGKSARAARRVASRGRGAGSSPSEEEQ